MVDGNETMHDLLILTNSKSLLSQPLTPNYKIIGNKSIMLLSVIISIYI